MDWATEISTSLNTIIGYSDGHRRAKMVQGYDGGHDTSDNILLHDTAMSKLRIISLAAIPADSDEIPQVDGEVGCTPGVEILRSTIFDEY